MLEDPTEKCSNALLASNSAYLQNPTIASQVGLYWYSHLNFFVTTGLFSPIKSQWRDIHMKRRCWLDSCFLWPVVQISDRLCNLIWVPNDDLSRHTNHLFLLYYKREVFHRVLNGNFPVLGDIEVKFFLFLLFLSEFLNVRTWQKAANSFDVFSVF